MAKLVIRGGNRLCGTVRPSGAKNAVLKLMAAALLSRETSTIHNVPKLTDVEYMITILRHLGAEISWENGTLRITPGEQLGTEVPVELARQLRASVQVLGPLLAREGQARVAEPGGCNFGSRPIDYHLKGLEALGAKIAQEHGLVTAKATWLRGTEFTLDFPSVGATENLMMAATLAEGVTLLHNVAKEPEIVEEQTFLRGMGAKVSGAGTDTIRVEGVGCLHGVEHTLFPDRIEVGTFMIAAAITRGEVILKEVEPFQVEAVSAKLREAGIKVEKGDNWLKVSAAGPPRGLNVYALPYPGFPTDLQPQIMALLALGEGTSVITDTIFSNRFRHVDELRRMGANIRVEGATAVVRGVPQLSGTTVEAQDLRGGVALVLAALAAKGETVIEGVSHLDRGYERLEEKLAALGANIIRLAQ